MNKLNVLGTNTPFHAETLIDTVWKKWYQHSLCSSILHRVEENKDVNDTNFKKVDPKLQKLIGVYPINFTTEPLWVEGFITLAYQRLCQLYNGSIDLMPGYKDFKVKDEYRNYGNFIDFKNEFHEALYLNTDYIEGVVVKGKRKTKILKWIASQFAKAFEGIKPEFLEKEEFYKYYNKHKESNKKLYLVISNSIPSFIGMSSYAPEKYNGSRIWSSCQNHRNNNEDYSRSSWCNLTDKGSLIMYITDGQEVEFDGLDGFNHYQMYTRYMIRLIVRNEESVDKDNVLQEETAVMIDRAYPNDQYTTEVFKMLQKICKQNDLRLTIPRTYNSGQESAKFEEFSIVNTKSNVTTSIDMYSAHKISFVTESSEDQDCDECSSLISRGCNGCRKSSCRDCDHDGQSHCEDCIHYSHECIGRNCSDCEEAPCRNSDCIYKHYDDQNGSGQIDSAWNADYRKKVYYERYIVINPILIKEMSDENE